MSIDITEFITFCIWKPWWILNYSVERYFTESRVVWIVKYTGSMTRTSEKSVQSVDIDLSRRLLLETTNKCHKYWVISKLIRKSASRNWALAIETKTFVIISSTNEKVEIVWVEQKLGNSFFTFALKESYVDYLQETFKFYSQYCNLLDFRRC